MHIRVDRESVCAADDVCDNSKVFCMAELATYEDLFRLLKEQRYFPSIYGNNVVWVLTAAHSSCIFSYFTKTGKLFMHSPEKSLKKLCGASRQVYLKYYSSPVKWKKELQATIHQGMYAMHHDECLEELEYCDYLTE